MQSLFKITLIKPKTVNLCYFFIIEKFGHKKSPAIAGLFRYQNIVKYYCLYWNS